MPVDFIFNGQAHGGVAERLLQSNMDYNVLRPFLEKDGYSYTNYLDNNGELQTMRVNAPASLTRDAWKFIDDQVIEAATPSTKIIADLRGRGLQKIIPNGMSKTMLEYQTISDTTPATISMDGMRRSEADRPESDIALLPLPIIHKDFHFTLREVLASRNSPMALDTTQAEQSARSVIEEAEKLVTGTASSYSYGGGTVYGMVNFPGRLTKTLTAPTSSNHATTINEIIDMTQKSRDDFYRGPWLLYASPDWATSFAQDYIANYPGTFLARIREIPGITSVEIADFLPAKTLVLVQATSNVIREVIGMELVTLQWETQGGMQLNYKVMAILVPQIRADQNGNTGIVHGSYT